MDIHKPKPAHSWRDFLVEIGTIVIGVLIALTAEQAVEAVHMRHLIEADRRILARELALDLSDGVIRMRMAPCVDARLNALSAQLDQAERAGRLPPMPVPGRPRDLVFSSGGWNNVVASTAAPHFPPEELYALEFVYHLMATADRVGEDESHAWSQIYTMAGPGRPLDPGVAQSLRVALTDARTNNLKMATIATRTVGMIDALHLRFDNADKDRIRRALTSPLSVLDTRHICETPSTVIPPNYGQSSWTGLLPESAGALKDLQGRFR